MLKYIFVCVALLALPGMAPGGEMFDRYFLDKTLRVDLFHTGTKGTETISLDHSYLEGMWAGSLVNLIDTLNLGEYQARVFDVASASLIFSVGYSAMFNEWQSTDEALAGTYKAPDGATIKVESLSDEDRRRFHVTEKGITLITPDMLGQKIHH